MGRQTNRQTNLWGHWEEYRLLYGDTGGGQTSMMALWERHTNLWGHWGRTDPSLGLLGRGETKVIFGGTGQRTE